ncbi:hypothetical protein [Amycolatopsis sp. NPDC004625]|uniref:hypothetical protein n=1 Tax=Amycolatopsis sp. NPDC004625 TaxID=3154670 RepID=UPI0033AAA514
MTATTTQSAPSDHSESAYARACRLIETELGGRRLPPEPRTWLEDLARTRRHKTALITAVWNTCFPSNLVEACRVVEAVYPTSIPTGSPPTPRSPPPGTSSNPTPAFHTRICRTSGAASPTVA